MKCDDCGHELQIGEWPYCPHERPGPSKGFEPYWDENISDQPVWITGPGSRTPYLKPHWENDHLVHVQPREKPASYYRELRDRREARTREG